MPFSVGVRSLKSALVLAAIALSVTFHGPLSAQQPLALGESLPEFALKDVQGVPYSSIDAAAAPATVVVFMGWECPMAKLYVPRLNALREKFADDGVTWLAINSNQHDSLEELQAFITRSGFALPLLKDPGNRVADLFGATRTPEVFVFDVTQKLVYHGQIDDQYAPGLQRAAVTRNYLADVLSSLIAAEPVSVLPTEPTGCLIGRVLTPRSDGDAGVTYSQQVSRILQDKCVQCHRPGEIGPFALTSYDEVAGWAGMIQEVVNERRMPPWHAAPEHGSFRNDCRLSSDEIELINAWVDAGAPEGDPAELPEPRTWATGWQIGEPDLVIPMAKQPFSVPATGTVEYKYFKVDPGFTEDKWVTAAECRPGNRAVIHHIIVGILGEGEFGDDAEAVALQSDWIAATAPGSPPMILPDGYAKRIPAGSRLVFQMHYTPNGTATEDLSSIGLRFVDEATVKKQVVTLKAFNPKFRIPPGAENHRVDADFRFRQDAELLSLFPHMHLRGKAFRYTAHFPDGTSEILLDVPGYDFNWQNAYELTEPLAVPRGTRLDCMAHFDNSENNLANPAPEQTVRWGDQTWEEMMIGYFNVAVDRDEE